MAVQEELYHQLTEMLELIANRAGGDQVLAKIARIDQLKDQLDQDAPPMLRHCLEKRSYAKALEFFQGQLAETKPKC